VLRVRPAAIDDLPAIVRLIDEAAEWLRGMDTDQWAEPWPSRKKRDARIRRGLRKGRTWIVEEPAGTDPVIVATISCRPEPNRGLWNREEQAQRALYVSRLVINRAYEGQQIGSELLDWAGKWARVQYDAEFIRLDVWTTNRKLHEYYLKRGFGLVRKCNVDYPSAVILQRPTADLDTVETPRLSEEPQLLIPTTPTFQERLQFTLAATLGDLRPWVQSDSAAELPPWVCNLYIAIALIPAAFLAKQLRSFLNHEVSQAP
jgi:GNAT superfamily N-acetyltransferase